MKSLAVATTEEPYVTYRPAQGHLALDAHDRRYVFRNAMLPQVTALALSLGTVFNGALLTEILFSYPGMGLIDAHRRERAATTTCSMARSPSRSSRSRPRG